MDDKIVVTFCLCDDLLKAIHHPEDHQCHMNDSTSKSAARRCPLFGTQEVKTILSHTGGPVLSMTMESSGGANGVPLSFS